MFLGVAQCTDRSLLGNRLTRHLAIAVLVALWNWTFRAPHSSFLANMVFGELMAVVVQHHNALVKTDNRRSSKCDRGFERDAVVYRRRRRRGMLGL
jgi:hypothetical protein